MPITDILIIIAVYAACMFLGWWRQWRYWKTHHYTCPHCHMTFKPINFRRAKVYWFKRRYMTCPKCGHKDFMKMRKDDSKSWHSEQMNMSDYYEITRADRSDLQEILELQYSAFKSEAELLNDFSIPPLKQTYDEVEREYEKGVFLKATDDTGKIIGSVRAYIDNDTAFIGKLIVHPQKQGQGIGTNLLFAIERECDVERCELFASDKSVRNIQLYERLGYVRFKEQRISDNVTLVYLEIYI